MQACKLCRRWHSIPGLRHTLLPVQLILRHFGTRTIHKTKFLGIIKTPVWNLRQGSTLVGVYCVSSWALAVYRNRHHHVQANRPSRRRVAHAFTRATDASFRTCKAHNVNVKCHCLYSECVCNKITKVILNFWAVSGWPNLFSGWEASTNCVTQTWACQESFVLSSTESKVKAYSWIWSSKLFNFNHSHLSSMEQNFIRLKFDGTNFPNLVMKISIRVNQTTPWLNASQVTRQTRQ